MKRRPPTDRTGWTLEQYQQELRDRSSVDSECWLWTGSQVCGYGKHKAFGVQRAHRISYRVFKANGDPIPSELMVRHTCDRKLCVNPGHLELGTHRDNMNDMKVRGRAASGDRNAMRLYPDRVPRGERNGMKKGSASAKRVAEKLLKVPRVRWGEVYARRKAGEIVKALAAEFGCNGNAIYRLCERYEREMDSYSQQCQSATEQACPNEVSSQS